MRLALPNPARQRPGRSIWPVLSAALALLLVVLLAPDRPVAHAADAVATNNGFESGLTGWTQFAGGGNITTIERAYEGAASAKIVDADSVNSTGLESIRLPAEAGSRYAAFARFYVQSGTPELYLRFYTSSGGLTGNFFTSFSGPTGAWVSVRVTGTAPANAVRMSVLPYSSKANVGTVYVDQVLISEAVTDLGWQINNAGINGSTFGIGANQDKIYGIYTGSNDATRYPALFATIDADTESIVGTPAKLTGAIGGWAATTATDGNVYLGSYSNGHVYRHTPGSSGISDLGQAMAGEGFIWCLTAGTDGRIYGGTYAGAGYFKYEPANGFDQIGTKPIWPNKDYVRSIAFDPAKGATYLGVGTDAALIRFDRVTGQKDDILPIKYRSISMVGGLTFTGGRLFTAMASGVMSVLNVVEQADGSYDGVEEASFPSSMAVSPARNGKVYLLNSGGLASYDVGTGQLSPVGVSTNLAPKQFGWVRLADQANWPGETLVMVGGYDGRTWLLKYNPTTGTSRTAEVGNPPWQPTHINSIATGPDGNIYTGGYLSGHTGLYRPLRGDGDDESPDQVYRGLSQTDSMLAYNGKLYFGNYSGAKVHEYDLTQPWNMGTNPQQLMALSGHGQDRPYALAAGGGKLFVGTVPGYGEHDGALTVYELATKQQTVERNLVTNQSVVALAYHNGLVWGGTTVRGGLGVEDTPVATEAKLFVYDPASRVKTEYSLPASRKLKSLTALRVIDGKIWGIAEGFVFVFNPATRTFTTNPVEKFPEVVHTFGSWSDAKLLTIARDPGYVYGTVGDHLFKMNKSTLAVTKLISMPGVNNLAADEFDNIYYSRYERLYRYVP